MKDGRAVILINVLAMISSQRKFLGIRKESRAAAIGVFVSATGYSRFEEESGFCPLEAIEAIAAPDILSELVRVGLFTAHEQDDGIHGFLIHKYSKFNETKEEIDARLLRDRRRKKRTKIPTGFQLESTLLPTDSVGIPQNRRGISGDGAGEGEGSDPDPDLRATSVPGGSGPRIPDPLTPEMRAIFASVAMTNGGSVLGKEDPVALWALYRDARMGSGRAIADLGRDWSAWLRHFVRNEMARSADRVRRNGALADASYVPPPEEWRPTPDPPDASGPPANLLACLENIGKGGRSNGG